MAESKEIKYEVIQDFGTIEEPISGYDTRVKLISWNGGQPKLDIRKWNKDNDKMSKGISLSLESLNFLMDILYNMVDNREEYQD